MRCKQNTHKLSKQAYQKQRNTKHTIYRSVQLWKPQHGENISLKYTIIIYYPKDNEVKQVKQNIQDILHNMKCEVLWYMFLPRYGRPEHPSISVWSEHSSCYRILLSHWTMSSPVQTAVSHQKQHQARYHPRLPLPDDGRCKDRDMSLIQASKLLYFAMHYTYRAIIIISDQVNIWLDDLHVFVQMHVHLSTFRLLYGKSNQELSCHYH